MSHGLRALLAVVALAAAGPAAGGERFLGWNDATPNHQSLPFDCNDPPAEAVLVAAFEAPSATIHGLVANVDMCTIPNELPAWWRFDLPGGCREGTIGVSTNFAGGPSSFASPWSGAMSATVATQFGGSTWSVAMNRFSVTVTGAAGQPFTVVPGTTYYAFKLVFTTPKGACEGCAMQACFVLNSLDVLTDTGLVPTTMDYANWVNWQGGQFDCPFVVPAAAATWGRVKAAYR